MLMMNPPSERLLLLLLSAESVWMVQVSSEMLVALLLQLQLPVLLM